VANRWHWALLLPHKKFLGGKRRYKFVWWKKGNESLQTVLAVGLKLPVHTISSDPEHEWLIDCKKLK